MDVAKEAADIVLLEKDLGVLVQGVREGRTTFANTLKYVFMATQRQFRQHVQHGRSIPLPEVEAVFVKPQSTEMYQRARERKTPDQ